jgi:hypothetical protein
MSWITDYRKSLKMKEVEEIFDLILYRPLAFIFVKSIIRTNITPNHLTFAAIIMGIIAGCFYSQGNQSCFIAGGLFYLLFNVLDCSDGQLARLKKNGTHIGRIIDGIADYIAVVSVFIGVGIGFAAKSGNPAFWWIMLALAGLSNIIHSVLVDYYRNSFLDYVLERKNMFDEDLEDYKKEYEAIKDDKSKRLTKIIIRIYIKYMKFQGSITAKKKDVKLFKTTPQEYFQKNKTAIRIWVLLGPTSQITAMIICTMLMRVDIFCWIMVVGFNAIAILAWALQKRIDKTFNSAIV